MRTTHFDPSVLEQIAQWKNSTYSQKCSRLERLAKQLPRALEDELTPRQRQLITMYYFEGKSMTQIGEELHLSVSTVSRSITRAMERLFRSLRYFL